MGTALGAWLSQAGLPPEAMVSRRRPAALGRRFHADAWSLESWRAKLGALAPHGVLLAVPDDALVPLARRLSRARSDWRGWYFLHTSGARDASALEPLRRRGAAVGSVHPMMTFPKGRPVPSPADVVFSIEGDGGARRRAVELVWRWRGVPLHLAPKAKTAYHLAATLVGPGTVVELAVAERLLRRAGLRGATLRRALGGLRMLLGATIKNLSQGAATAWTGPWARGDAETQKLHLRTLGRPEERQLYRALASLGAELFPYHTRKH